MDQEKIGKFILKLRKEKNMTQQELADMLNVTDRAISHWENGRSIPDVSLFKPLCEIFNITVNELLSGEILDKNTFIKKSDENIINTLTSTKETRRRSKLIVSILFICIIVLLAIIIFNIKSKYPKINMQNFIIKPTNGVAKLEQKYRYRNHSIYYYGLDFVFLCDKDDKCYKGIDAFNHNQISLDKFKDYFEKQQRYENYESSILKDGGTTIYSKGNLQVVFCNTIEGNKDIYIGTSNMLDELSGEYCGKAKNNDKTFVRTYKVISSSSSTKSEFNNVLLESLNGQNDTVMINNDYALIPGHTYEFSFMTFSKYKDTIANIFKNSTLMSVVEVSSTPDNYIDEAIVVNENN